MVESRRPFITIDRLLFIMWRSPRDVLKSMEVHMRKIALISALVMCLGTAPALALSEKSYLTASDADFANLLPPPPADGSTLDKRDLQGVLDLQKTVTPARMEKIQADVEQTVYRVAGEVLGPTFT